MILCCWFKVVFDTLETLLWVVSRSHVDERWKQVVSFDLPALLLFQDLNRHLHQYLMLSRHNRILYPPIGLIRYYMTCLVEIA